MGVGVGPSAGRASTRHVIARPPTPSCAASHLIPSIGRLVADAQAREAPVQRLADVVAGRFCYGVMAASATTFAFWSLAGADLFPQALGEQA